MAKEKQPITPAQGGEGDDPKLIDHVVTQEDLDSNPELAAAEVKVGDTIQIPAKSDVPAQCGEGDDDDDDQDHDQIPEWAAKALVDIFEPLFKALSDEISDLKKALVKANKEATPNAVASVEDDFDEDSDYVVASGKSFRDSNDFTKEYAEGDDVSHLDKEVQKRLFANGLIEES
jgi:hypothetical protein